MKKILITVLCFFVSASLAWSDCCERADLETYATWYINQYYSGYTMKTYCGEETTAAAIQDAINAAILSFHGTTTPLGMAAFQYVSLPAATCPAGGRVYWRQSPTLQVVYYGVYTPEICQDAKYSILGAAFCSTGELVGFEFCACIKDPETGLYSPDLDNTAVCGNSQYYYLMKDGAIIGSIESYRYETYPPECNVESDEISQLCAQAGTGSGCGEVEDEDGDGVPDNEDRCPGTPFGVEVNQYGCDPNDLDADGDGVPDGTDLCPGTPYNTVVDQYGCPVDSGLDTDGDGVPDADDTCPGTPPGTPVGPNGCPADSGAADPNDGVDNDDDSGLLGQISDWLNKIAGGVGQIIDQITGVGETLNEINETLNESPPSYSDPAANSWDGLSQAVQDVENIMETESTLDDMPEEMREKSVLYDLITGVIDNNPITDPFSGVSINASGDCSMSVDIFSRPVVFSLCQWQDQVNTMGTILLWISTLAGMLIIFKR